MSGNNGCPPFAAYFSGLGWQRFFLLFATRPQDLQMNFGLFTSFLIFFRSRLQEQQVRAHILLSPHPWVMVLLLMGAPSVVYVLPVRWMICRGPLPDKLFFRRVGRHDCGSDGAAGCRRVSRD